MLFISLSRKALEPAEKLRSAAIVVRSMKLSRDRFFQTSVSAFIPYLKFKAGLRAPTIY